MTSFMSCIEMLDVYSNEDVASKIVKAVTDVYLENWNVDSLDEFGEVLSKLKVMWNQSVIIHLREI